MKQHLIILIEIKLQTYQYVNSELFVLPLALSFFSSSSSLIASTFPSLLLLTFHPVWHQRRCDAYYR